MKKWIIIPKSELRRLAKSNDLREQVTTELYWYFNQSKFTKKQRELAEQGKYYAVENSEISRKALGLEPLVKAISKLEWDNK